MNATIAGGLSARLGPRTGLTASIISSAGFPYTTNLVLGLDGDRASATGVRPSLGDNVSNWFDFSGNGNNPTQGVMANQPVVTSGSNGHLGVLGNGVNTSLQCSSSIVTTDATVFIVFNPLDLSNPYTSLLSNEFFTGQGWTYLLKSNGKTAFYWTSSSGSVSYDGTGVGTITSGTPVISVIRWNALGASSYVNGVLDGSTSALVGSMTASNLTVGSSAYPSRIFNGIIDYIPIYNAFVSNSNVNLVGRFLAGRFSIPWTDL